MFRTVSFWIGTISCIALWCIITILDYKTRFDGLCMDCDNDFGFPFGVYQSGGLAHATDILWLGIAGNTIVAVGSSVIVGYLGFRVVSRCKLH